MLRLKERNGKWYVIGRLEGVDVKKSTGLPAGRATKSAAELVLRDEEQRIITAHRDGIVRGKRIGDLVDLYVNRPEGVDPNSVGYVRRFQAYCERNGAPEVFCIREPMLMAYVRDEFKGASPSTVKRALNPVRAMFNYAHKAKWVLSVPAFPMPKVKEERLRYLMPEQRDRVIACCDGDLAYLMPLVTFLFFTGARLGEACTLEWDDVDIKNRTVTLVSMKGGKLKRRLVPMHERVMSVMLVLRGRRIVGQKRVFLREDGSPWPAHQNESSRSSHRIYEPWAKLMERAGITDFTPHDCRHTFASVLRMQGHDLDVIADLLGHESLDMVRRYAHLHPGHLRTAVVGMR